MSLHHHRLDGRPLTGRDTSLSLPTSIPAYIPVLLRLPDAVCRLVEETRSASHLLSVGEVPETYLIVGEQRLIALLLGLRHLKRVQSRHAIRDLRRFLKPLAYQSGLALDVDLRQDRGEVTQLGMYVDKASQLAVFTEVGRQEA